MGFTFLSMLLGIHRIQEGHVGFYIKNAEKHRKNEKFCVYYRGGALLQGISEPGYIFFIKILWFLLFKNNQYFTINSKKVSFYDTIYNIL